MLKYSFLVPVYNAEKNLEKCLMSLVLQKQITNYEIILYNDCSTDMSGTICDRYKGQFLEKIIVIHGKENLGPLKSRIELVKYATGDVIIFIDSDDYVEEEMLLTIDNAFRKYHCDMIIFEYWLHYDLVMGRAWDKHISVFDDICIYENDNKKKLYEIFAKGKINSIWRKACKKELFSFPYDDDIRDTVTVGEDVLFSLPMITNAKKIVCLNKPLYFYRCSQGGITRLNDAERLLHKIENTNQFYEQLSIYIKKWKIDEDNEILYHTICRSLLLYIDSILMIKDYCKREILYRQMMKYDLFYKGLTQTENNGKSMRYCIEGDYRKMERYLFQRKIKGIVRKIVFQLFVH